MTEEKADRYRGLAEAEREMAVVADREGTIRYVSGPAPIRTGRSPEQLVGEALSAVLPAELSDPRAGTLWEVLEREASAYSEYRVLGPQGEAWMATQLIPLRSDSGEVEAVLGISQDITERVRRRRDLASVSAFDEVTGQYNRRGFSLVAQERMNSANRMGRSMALLLCTLEYSKDDHLEVDPEVTDRALAATAALLRGSFRASDVLGRVGANSFAVLATGPFEGEIELLASRVRDALKAAPGNSPGGIGHRVEVSHIPCDPQYPCQVSELMARIPGTV